MRHFNNGGQAYPCHDGCVLLQLQWQCASEQLLQMWVGREKFAFLSCLLPLGKIGYWTRQAIDPI